jgi:HlyD family secretion protein/epimerase transport system membrane fusion protein
MTRHEVFARLAKSKEAGQEEEKRLAAGPLSTAKAPVRIGFALVLLFLLVFVAWGATAQLAGGAVAPGVISPDNSRKTVQHLEGGIIHELMVRDGDEVQAGQPLLILATAQPRASFDILLGQQQTLRAMQARLVAERNGREAPSFPFDLRTASLDLRAATEGQLQIFNTRRELHEARKRVLKQRIEQLLEQIRGYEAQVASASRQLELFVKEIAGKAELQRKGLIPLPTLLALQRAEAEISGRRGEYIAMIARTRQQIGETELQLLSLDSERSDQITNELDKTRVELANITERLTASEDVLARTAITAPVAGTVVNMKFKTIGGVIQRGEPILDIVPSEDKLLIKARVSPTDIDVVHTGLEARVHLTAYRSRNLPRIAGVVRYVSADRIVEEKTGTPYYMTHVEVSREELARLGPEIKLMPGMPAEVLIVTGQRTMFQYMFQPFLDAIRRSFREV